MSETMRAVRLDLTVEEHRRLRIEAAKADISMAAFVRQLIQAKFADDVPTNGTKSSGKEHRS